MIVEMKKAHIIVQKKEVHQALEHLRELGSIHVEPLEVYAEMESSDLYVEVKRISHALLILENYKTKNRQESFTNFKSIVDAIETVSAELDRLKKSVEARDVRIKMWKPWGNFEPQDIRDLVEKNVYIHLYEIPASQQLEVPEDAIVETISVKSGIRRCVVILTENISLPYERTYLPMVSMNEKIELQKKESEEIEQLTAKLTDFYKYRDALDEALRHVEEEVRLREVSLGMENHEQLMLLKGFCPVDDCKKIEKTAKEFGWGLSVEDVGDGDNVPTLLKNPQAVQLSMPALNVIEILPGYKEFDVSAVFLVFFTLFFGILIGDAAYGAIFMLGTIFAHIKLSKKMDDKKPFYLMYLLTGFTMIWGVLTGTYFGQKWLPSTVKAVVPWLNDVNNIQWLCFTIALVHLGLARLWSAKAKLPSITALGDIGWFLIVCGMYFLANMFVLNRPFPGFAGWLFIGGISLAFFFMFPPKQWLKSIGQEIIPFVLSVIGAGTDIISYIRLFAVGLATVAVADAANGMPEALPGGPGYVFMVFLHVLNLILAAMAILVHAIRLNVLEFSGHLGLEWVGHKYNPFKRITQEQT